MLYSFFRSIQTLEEAVHVLTYRNSIRRFSLCLLSSNFSSMLHFYQLYGLHALYTVLLLITLSAYEFTFEAIQNFQSCSHLLIPSFSRSLLFLQTLKLTEYHLNKLLIREYLPTA